MGNVFGFQRTGNIAQGPIFPSRTTSLSAGIDIFSPVDVRIPPHNPVTVMTGLRMVIPEGTFLWITTCSRQAQTGIIVSGGINDSDYQGELAVTLNNLTDVDLTIPEGERLGQGILIPFVNCDPIEIKPDFVMPYTTDRGNRGQLRQANDWVHTYTARTLREGHNSSLSSRMWAVVANQNRLPGPLPPAPETSGSSEETSMSSLELPQASAPALEDERARHPSASSPMDLRANGSRSEAQSPSFEGANLSREEKR